MIGLSIIIFVLLGLIVVCIIDYHYSFTVKDEKTGERKPYKYSYGECYKRFKNLDKIKKEHPEIYEQLVFGGPWTSIGGQLVDLEGKFNIKLGD